MNESLLVAPRALVTRCRQETRVCPNCVCVIIRAVPIDSSVDLLSSLCIVSTQFIHKPYNQLYFHNSLTCEQEENSSELDSSTYFSEIVDSSRQLLSASNSFRLAEFDALESIFVASVLLPKLSLSNLVNRLAQPLPRYTTQISLPLTVYIDSCHCAHMPIVRYS